jgi:hypothetical protein
LINGARKRIVGSNAFQTIIDEAAHMSIQGYKILVSEGCDPQDARSILPTNIATNIIAKFNLRTLADMAKVRLCTRTQGEYQDVFRAIRSEVLKVHPWAEPFIRVHCAATGVCCFPNYQECPIKPGVFNPLTGKAYDEKPGPLTLDEIQKNWEGTRFEATPKGMDDKDD